MMIEFSKEVTESKEMNEICKRVLEKIDKPKGRPRKANKLIKMSITITPSQMQWLEKTATEKGIERSELLRDCIDRCMKSEV